MAQQWLPLMDYAMKKGISLSTLRRYIKANKVSYKIENGRYLLLDEQTAAAPSQRQPQTGAAGATSVDPNAVQKLKTDLKAAQEEIAELKTLIAFYEERMHRSLNG